MADPNDTTPTEKHFLDVGDAEIVEGSDVIATKVSGAMRDADRFGLPSVKPPLSEALRRTRQTEGSEEPAPEQNAMAGKPAEVDEEAGSEDMLKPGGSAGSA